MSQEIKLVDLWFVLWKRKIVAVFCIFAAMVVSVLVVINRQPVYENKVLFQIGHIFYANQNLPLEDPVIFTKRIKDLIGKQQKEMYSPSISIDNSAKEILVTLSIRGPVKRELDGFFDEAINTVKKEHSIIFNRYLSYHQKTISELKQVIDAGTEKVALYEKQLNLMKRDGAVFDSLYLIERITDERRIIIDFKARLADTEMRMSEPFSIPSDIRSHSSVELQVSPGKKVVILLGGIIGLMIGILGAFSAEFLSNLRK